MQLKEQQAEDAALEMAEGKAAHAAEQAELETTLIEHFLALLSMPKPLLGLVACLI